MSKFILPYAAPINKNQKVAYINARIIDPESKFDQMGQMLTIGDKINYSQLSKLLYLCFTEEKQDINEINCIIDK